MAFSKPFLPCFDKLLVTVPLKVLGVMVWSMVLNPKRKLFLGLA